MTHNDPFMKVAMNPTNSSSADTPAALLFPKSISAPSTPRGIFDEGVTEDLSKELQIQLLREKLDFTEKQLEEKDKQLEHYKQLVKTLKDVLSEVSNRRGASAQAPQPVQPPTPVRPPPGFNDAKPQKNQIKGRKVKSFHAENRYREDDEDLDPPPFHTSVSDTAASWRRPPDEPFEPPKRPNSRMSKSISHPASLSSLADGKEAPPQIQMMMSGMNPTVNISPQHTSLTKSAPAGIPKKPSPPPVDQNSDDLTNGANSPKKINHQLKKSQSMTSVYSVLEENRLDMKFPELDQLIGQIYALSKYQQGCRFLQKKLDEKDEKNTNIILKELFNHLVELMTDPFGNYLFSKLVERCDSNQRERIITKIIPDIFTVAFDMYGTQSLQKMVPYLTEPQIEMITGALKQNTILLIKHNKANYLIQYCLDHLSAKHNQWIYDAVVENIEEVGRDRVGCVIVKRCIDHATDEQKNKLTAEIAKKSLGLVQDPFGNYVVQHVLQKFPKDEQSARLVRSLLGNISELCTGKFSSNVIEKCLQVADAETRSRMLDEITDAEVLPQLLNDRFANFVIQTALDVADVDQRAKLVKVILPHLGRHYSPYTKRLQKKILQV